MGPATVNPDTGKPYGSSFPVVSMKDSVRVHKALVDSLGIKKLKAVAGASGGSIQAMEWGAEYPQLVERVIHVIGPGLDIHPYVIGCSTSGRCRSRWTRTGRAATTSAARSRTKAWRSR